MKEAKALGWEEVDFAYVTGDAYVDHSSFGAAIISRVLESRGYKVGMNLILGTISASAVTAYGVYYKLQNFIFMPAYGLNNASIPIISFNYGAQMKKRISDAIKYALCYVTVIMMKVVREISGHFQGGEQYAKAVEKIRNINELISYLIRYMPMSAEDKYELLKTDSLKERSLRFMDDLLKQKEAVELNMELSEKISDNASKFYRKQILREQLKAIQKELNEDEEDGEEDGEDGEDNKDYRSRIEAAGMPEDIRKAALAEVKKLEAMGQGSAEESVSRNYLDFILALPCTRSLLLPLGSALLLRPRLIGRLIITRFWRAASPASRFGSRLLEAFITRRFFRLYFLKWNRPASVSLDVSICAGSLWFAPESNWRISFGPRSQVTVSRVYLILL